MHKIYLIGFFNVISNYLLCNYLERFERINCGCSLTTKRDIAKMMITSFYVIIVGKVLYPDIPLTAKLGIMMYTLIFDVIFISYIFELKSKTCKCNDNLQNVTTTMIYMYYLLLTLMVVSSIILILFTTVISGSNLK